MKLAFSRSLWHGRSSIGAVRQASSIRRAIDWASSYSGGIAHAACQRERAIRLDDPERHEQARDRRAVVDPAQRRADGAQPLRLAHLRLGDRAALDEPGDEVALGSQEGDHLRADADPGGGHGRGVLDLAADAEEVRVVAGEADDEARAAGRAGRPGSCGS